LTIRWKFLADTAGASFGTPNFSASLWGTGGSATPASSSWTPGNHGPSGGGLYYDDYGCECGSSFGYGVPLGPKTPSISIEPIKVGEPDFDNDAEVDVEDYLPERSVPVYESLIVTGVTENTYWNAFWQEYWGNDSPWGTTVAGIAQAFGGLAEAIVGVITFVPTSGVSSIIIVHGVDNVFTGIYQAFTGEQQRTLTSQGVGLGVEKTTGSTTAGLFTGEGVDLIVGLVGPGTASKMAGGQGFFGSLKSVSSDAWKAVKNVPNKISDWLVRTQYKKDVKALQNTYKELQALNKSEEEIARQLHAMRRELGIKYKDLTSPEELARILERNTKIYGDELGPSIEWLRTEGKKSWKDIIESAMRPGGGDLGY